MSKSYPNISATKKMDRWPASVKCEVCGNPATHRVTLEVNYFRGDDESVKACDNDKANLPALSNVLLGIK